MYVNSIYEWGHGNHVPIKVHLDNARAKESNGARDDTNKRMELSSKAERVVNPVAIASGKYHNAAITSDGLVYTWGLHAESLGRNTNSLTKQQQRRNSSPQLLSGLFTEHGGGAAVAIAASDQRTAVVCDNGALFTWGTTDGKDVLGHEGVRWQQLPRQVPGVHRAVNVAVAKEHTVLLIGASFPAIPKQEGVLSLDLVAARSAARHVDLFNVIPISIMAERTEVNSRSKDNRIGV
jgi:inhibitor of Bruton tyrosine kinase